MSEVRSANASAVTVVTQTRVEPSTAEGFAHWQQKISEAVAAQPGFMKETVMPPSPPAQVDWVILQRFASTETAVAWLRSDERQRLVAEAQPMLVGQDDVHLVHDSSTGVMPAPASAVISTRIKPGQENAYRQWERKIGAVQARSPGFQGYRFEPPVPGVQNDWLTILKFDSEANLQTWLNSTERKNLLEQAAAFTDEYHVRIVRTGFDQWFEVGVAGASSPPAWKQNMIVLLILAERGAKHVNINLLRYFSEPATLDSKAKTFLERGMALAMEWATHRLVVPHISQTIDSTVEAINAGLQSLKAGRSTLGKVAVIVDRNLADEK
jgi:uncharacterized protein